MAGDGRMAGPLAALTRLKLLAMAAGGRDDLSSAAYIYTYIYQVGAMSLSSAGSPSGSSTGGKSGKAEELRLGCLAASALWMLAETEATRHRLPVAQYAL